MKGEADTLFAVGSDFVGVTIQIWRFPFEGRDCKLLEERLEGEEDWRCLE
jgi:hypothetical protein